jgi:hypothetical protein
VAQYVLGNCWFNVQSGYGKYPPRALPEKVGLSLVWTAAEKDGIALPACVSRERLDYLASCEKVNQSVQVLWRQKLSDGTTPQIPQDHGLPVYPVYGTRAELKMRNIEKLGFGVQGIVQILYVMGLTIIPIQSQRWSLNAVMWRP